MHTTTSRRPKAPMGLDHETTGLRDLTARQSSVVSRGLHMLSGTPFSVPGLALAVASKVNDQTGRSNDSRPHSHQKLDFVCGISPPNLPSRWPDCAPSGCSDCSPAARPFSYTCLLSAVASAPP